MTWIPRDKLEIAGQRHDGAPLDAVWRSAIEYAGLEIPLLAFPSAPHRVILGARRARAVRAMSRYDDIPVYVAPTSHAMDAWLVADKELSADHLFGSGAPWTWRQRAALLDAALDTYGHGHGGGGGPRISLVEALAHYFEVHEVQLRNAAYLLRFEVGGSGGVEVEATAALDMVERGEIKPQSAYKKLRAGDPLSRMVTVAPSSPAPSAPASEQVKVLRGTVLTLHGILYGLRALGEISPDISEEDRAEIGPTFAEARRLFTKLARQLQVDTNKGE